MIWLFYISILVWIMGYFFALGYCDVIDDNDPLATVIGIIFFILVWPVFLVARLINTKQ
jgi:hypothetical protein